MTKQYVFVVVCAIMLGLAGGLSLTAHGAAQTEDARAVVDAIKELTRETSKLKDPITDVGRECRR